MSPLFQRLFDRSLARSRNRFPVVRRGYSPNEVDVFLDELERGVSVSDKVLLNKVFTTVKHGYDRAEVHRFLALQVTEEPVEMHPLPNFAPGQVAA